MGRLHGESERVAVALRERERELLEMHAQEAAQAAHVQLMLAGTTHSAIRNPQSAIRTLAGPGQATWDGTRWDRIPSAQQSPTSEGIGWDRGLTPPPPQLHPSPQPPQSSQLAQLPQQQLPPPPLPSPPQPPQEQPPAASSPPLRPPSGTTAADCVAFSRSHPPCPTPMPTEPASAPPEPHGHQGAGGVRGSADGELPPPLSPRTAALCKTLSTLDAEVQSLHSEIDSAAGWLHASVRDVSSVSAH